MEVKGLLEKIRHKEQEQKEAYFALQIGLDFVRSAVWLIDKGKVGVICVGQPVAWEKGKLLKAVDASLSSAVEGFSVKENEIIQEPNKVIFGLPAQWVEEDKINQEKLAILKEVSQKLELKPVGFVVIAEAIAHYLKIVEGVPPSLTLLCLSKQQAGLTLIRLGRVFKSHLVERSQSLGDDVLEGLSRYKESEPFPARILLYGHQVKLENDQQALANYAWEADSKTKKIKFLQPE